jgi:hypothetical protein
MNSLQKLGSLGALSMTVYFFAILMFVLVILPGQGLGTEAALNDPSQVLPVWSNSSVLFWFNVVDLPFALGLALVVLALYERVQDSTSNLARLARLAGIVAIPLFLATGMTAILGTPPLARIYEQNAASAGAAFLAVNALHSGLGLAAVFAFGWWLVLGNWSVLQSHALPKPLGYVGILFGVSSILFFLFPVLAPVTLILGLVWSPWTGIVLLRSQAATANGMAVARA